MPYKSRSLFVLVLVIILAVPTLMLAATETVSGKVESVDANSGTLVIETDEDESKEIKAPKEMLEGLKPGDEVTVTIEEGTAQTIEKNDEES